jgi:hypothetical protein
MKVVVVEKAHQMAVQVMAWLIHVSIWNLMNVEFVVVMEQLVMIVVILILNVELHQLAGILLEAVLVLMGRVQQMMAVVVMYLTHKDAQMRI